VRHIRVAGRVVFTSDGIDTIGDARRLHRLRRSFCKSWRYTPHSHSIVLRDDNTLIYRCDFSAMRQRTDLPIRQEFVLLNLQGDFAESEFARFQGLSASIGRFSRALQEWLARPDRQKDRQPWQRRSTGLKSRHRLSDRMSLSIAIDQQPETDLGYPLHKRSRGPARIAASAPTICRCRVCRRKEQLA
jgi:hypothetical protein